MSIDTDSDYEYVHPEYYGIDLYLHKIRTWAHKYGFSAHGLAKACDMSPGTLQKMFRKEWNPTVNTLAALEYFMYNYEKKMEWKAKMQK
ncbi:MAG: hypothetical protein Unbinned1190contig1000_17 [Prokaryotic dsDNA virus sp.]|nr:MAG: hypothetical protein Unbinned1190contig1000_17 [Prokaryotic dsDNA virus sp.]